MAINTIDMKRSKVSGRNKYWNDSEMIKHLESFKKATTQEERDSIWDNHLHKPMEKLAECSVNGYDWHYIKEHYGISKIIEQVTTHLYTAIDKFEYDKDKGTTFSYFNMTAKNHLLNWNNKLYALSKIEVNVVPIFIGETDNDEDTDYKELTINPSAEFDWDELVKLSAKYYENNWQRFGKHPKYKTVVMAIIDILNNVQYIQEDWDTDEGRIKNNNRVGKKDILKVLRGRVNLSTPQITSALLRVRFIQKQLMREYVDHGTCEGIYVTNEMFNPFYYGLSVKHSHKNKNP